MGQRRAVIASIVCGVVCALAVLLYTNGVRSEAESERMEALSRYGGEQLEVCVATRDIAPGETVSSADVTMKLWVSDLLPEGAVKSSNDIVGKKASSSIMAGEVVLEQRFSNIESLIDVPAGQTALSVPAKSVQAVGGAIDAGMTVDLYATGNTSTTRIANNVLVLATSTTHTEGSTSSKSEVSWITIAVNPSLVEQMVAAAQNSELYFTLPSQSQEN